MSKLLENIFRSVNIALVNELALLSERMDIDLWEVIEAAKTKPFGFMPFYPGPGVGGHCIPVDPYYLSWKAREYDFYTKFIELAAEVNQAMPYHVVDLVAQALSQQGKPLDGARVLILGVAFKRDIDDARNSPAERIIELLLKRGAEVSYSDPYVPRYRVGRDVFYRGGALAGERGSDGRGSRGLPTASSSSPGTRSWTMPGCSATPPWSWTRATPPRGLGGAARVVRVGAPLPERTN